MGVAEDMLQEAAIKGRSVRHTDDILGSYQLDVPRRLFIRCRLGPLMWQMLGQQNGDAS